MIRSIVIGAAATSVIIGAGVVMAGYGNPRVDAASVAQTRPISPSTPTLATPSETSLRVVWPTPYPRLETPADDRSYLQATASGNPASGGYGMVRDAGSRYHEGIDIRPVSRDRRGEPLDAVVAAMAGRVAYVNTRTNGAYGRYVVLEHPPVRGLSLYTLYAHLAAVDTLLRAGTQIPEGTRLGLMGRSDGGGGFPRERAHLHFEIGLRLSDNFNRWYTGRRYPDPNAHDNFNGINLAGLDPDAFFRLVRENNGKLTPGAIRNWVKSQAVTVVVETPSAGRAIPPFIRHNSALVSPALPGSAPAGWRIGFTAYGAPISWQPIAVAPPSTRVVLVDGPLATDARRRGMVSKTSAKRGLYTAGSSLETALELLFTP